MIFPNHLMFIHLSSCETKRDPINTPLSCCNGHLKTQLEKGDEIEPMVSPWLHVNQPPLTSREGVVANNKKHPQLLPNATHSEFPHKKTHTHTHPNKSISMENLSFFFFCGGPTNMCLFCICVFFFSGLFI